jgi:hypothetical protein
VDFVLKWPRAYAVRCAPFAQPIFPHAFAPIGTLVMLADVWVDRATVLVKKTMKSAAVRGVRWPPEFWPCLGALRLGIDRCLRCTQVANAQIRAAKIRKRAQARNRHDPATNARSNSKPHLRVASTIVPSSATTQMPNVILNAIEFVADNTKNLS